MTSDPRWVRVRGPLLGITCALVMFLGLATFVLPAIGLTALLDLGWGELYGMEYPSGYVTGIAFILFIVLVQGAYLQIAGAVERMWFTNRRHERRICLLVGAGFVAITAVYAVPINLEFVELETSAFSVGVITGIYSGLPLIVGLAAWTMYIGISERWRTERRYNGIS